MNSLDQQRAALAYRRIAEEQPAVVRMVRGLPDMLRTNGLLATWAFLISKRVGTDGREQPSPLPILLEHLRNLPELEVEKKGDAESVFRAWVGGATGQDAGVSGPQLRALTAEALAFAGWLKRAAEARSDVADVED